MHVGKFPSDLIADQCETLRVDGGSHTTLPRSHLYVKLSRRSHVRRFSRNGVGRGYRVAVTGSTWPLRDVRGCYGMYIATFQYAPRRPRNCHEVATSHSISRKVHWVALTSFAHYTILARRDHRLRIWISRTRTKCTHRVISDPMSVIASGQNRIVCVALTSGQLYPFAGRCDRAKSCLV